MGPRSFERGNERSATTRRSQCAGFNGAALVRARKWSAAARYRRASTIALQWGRARSSAEICAVAAGYRCRRADASMGPRSFERGNDVQRRAALDRDMPASMGPRSFERGNADAIAAQAAVRVATLQWGRARSSAEIADRSDGVAIGYCASMGPRSFERGNPRAPARRRRVATGFNGAALVRARKYGACDAWRIVALAVASMGPRSFERGNRSTLSGHRRARRLQWGRARSSAEISSTDACGAVERRCFNGAALVRARKSAVAATLSASDVASMGPRSFERGNSSRRVTSRRVGRFNGAALVRARKSLAPTGSDAHAAASMGPRSFERGNPSVVSAWLSKTDGRVSEQVLTDGGSKTPAAHRHRRRLDTLQT